MKALVVPPAAQRDEKSVQMLSAWIAEKGLHCVINVGVWEKSSAKEASAWGILLADTIRHIAHALQDEYGHSAQATIETVLESLNNELIDPTSPATGAFHHGHT